MDEAARDRVAVVTGAGRGLGRAVAVALAGRGHPVVGVARDAAQLAETADLASAGGGRIFTRPTDVADTAAVADLGDFVRAQLGPPAILVNAAGMFGPIAFVRDTAPDDWVRTVMVDGIAPFLTINQFVGGMIDAGWGRIVNISSGAGRSVSLTGIQAYASAKAGQIGLTRQTAHELGRFCITVNCIAPGFVLSNPTTQAQWESYGEEGQAALVEGIAVRRLGTPEDIANGVRFFVSEASSWVTGQTLSIDGGHAIF